MHLFFFSRGRNLFYSRDNTWCHRSYIVLTGSKLVDLGNTISVKLVRYLFSDCTLWFEIKEYVRHGI